MKYIWLLILWLCYAWASIHPWMAMFCIIIFWSIFALYNKKELKKEWQYYLMLIWFWTSVSMFALTIYLSTKWIVIFN